MSGKHKGSSKPFYKRVWFWIIVVLIVGGIGNLMGLGDTSESTSSSAPSTTSSSKKVDYNAVKIGMTKKKVVALIGKPSSKSKYVWTYKGKDVLFTQDSAETVQGGDLGTLQDQAKKAADSSKAAASNAVATQKSFAESFGRKTTDHLAKYPMVYKTGQLDANTVYYLWDSGHGKMIRLDTSDRMTNVYLYDKDADYGKGKLLFTGRTQFQDAKTYVFY